MQSCEIFGVREVRFSYFTSWFQFEVLKNIWDHWKWFNRVGILAQCGTTPHWTGLVLQGNSLAHRPISSPVCAPVPERYSDHVPKPLPHSDRTVHMLRSRPITGTVPAGTIAHVCYLRCSYPLRGLKAEGKSLVPFSPHVCT
jgi:hypothetical protein